MNKENMVKEMRELESRLHAYEHAMGVMEYDAVTAAPSESFKGRGETLAYLSEISHNLFICESTRNLLEELSKIKNELEFQEQRELEKLTEEFDHESKIPTDEFVAYRKLLNESESVWHEAKLKSDFSMFEPFLEKIVDENIRIAGYYDNSKKPYDVLLDQYEKGFTTSELDKYFEDIGRTLIPLVREVESSSVKIDDSFLKRNYPAHLQKKFALYLMKIQGIDDRYCSLGETEHPFTTNFNKYDVRITTHYYENNVASSMYSVIHEGGHALYELNTDDRLSDTCLATGTSMGIHEGQSRFYENIIGRSRQYISLVFPKLKEIFPDQLNDVNENDFYMAVNKSEPSLVRTEADELTYSLHIMVRYEIEKLLISKEIKVHDLPGLWNEMMKKYLGITVPNDRKGVLQDSHWSSGSFGYFPSYSLGSAYGAQILDSMNREFDVMGAVSEGHIENITSWLTKKIFKYGSELKPKEIIKNCCSAEFTPQYYLDYLSSKYKKIYKL
jgi:carboxypeptidase Taq